MSKSKILDLRGLYLNLYNFGIQLLKLQNLRYSSFNNQHSLKVFILFFQTHRKSTDDLQKSFVAMKNDAVITKTTKQCHYILKYNGMKF